MPNILSFQIWSCDGFIRIIILYFNQTACQELAALWAYLSNVTIPPLKTRNGTKKWKLASFDSNSGFQAPSFNKNSESKYKDSSSRWFLSFTLSPRSKMSWNPGLKYKCDDNSLAKSRRNQLFVVTVAAFCQDWCASIRPTSYDLRSNSILVSDCWHDCARWGP